jgi:hypothetical protein
MRLLLKPNKTRYKCMQNKRRGSIEEREDDIDEPEGQR